jgi:hypothetical protein
MNKTGSSPMSYNDRMIRLGIITVSCAIIANFIPALYLWIFRGIVPSVSTILGVWSLAAVTYGVGWIVQPITYFSIMGVSGSYIGWVAGNVADLRGPCSRMAQNVVGVEADSPQGEIMSTIGITSSVFVSAAVITIFTFIGANILPLMPPFVTKSFTYILPAVFGAVYADLSSKHLDVGIGTFVVGMALLYMLPKLGVNAGLITVAVIVASVLIGRICYVARKKK